MANPIISIIVIILSLGFSFFYVTPEYAITQKRSVDITTLDRTLKDAGEIQSLINQTETTLNSINPVELSRFAVFLPETTDTLRLANNIQHVGIAHGITIEQLKVDDTSKKGQSADLSGVQGVAADVSTKTSTPQYTTVKTTFSMTTSDEAFRAFLADLEKNLGIMNVTTLTFTPVTDAASGKIARSAAPQYKYSVAIETYALK